MAEVRSLSRSETGKTADTVEKTKTAAPMQIKKVEVRRAGTTQVEGSFIFEYSFSSFVQ